MTLAVGSTNPVKIQALEEVILQYPDLAGISVVSYSVPSGIAEQPMSLEETIQGAKNRAKRAFEASGSSLYGFGIESGLFKALGSETGYLEACACSIYDGSRFTLGLSCGFEIPPQILSLMLQNNIDMSQACYLSGVTQNTKLGTAEGLIGVLTKGRIDRKKYTMQAIMTALIQLEHSHLYR